MASKLILGTVQFGLDYGINNDQGRPSGRTVEEILDFAYQSGIQKLDTAEAYGDAHTVIGDFHKKRDIRFDINTKFRGITKGNLRFEVTKALEELGVEKLNTWFYHSFQDYSLNREWADGLAQVKWDGLIQNIGVSVYSNSELESVIEDSSIDVIQLPFNLLDNVSQRGILLEKAKKYNKTIQIRSVFLQGLFFKSVSALPSYLLPLKSYLEQLHHISDETGISMEALCLQYVESQEFVDEIIIGVDSKQHLMNNIASLNSKLDKNIINVIDDIQVLEKQLLYPSNWK